MIGDPFRIETLSRFVLFEKMNSLPWTWRSKLLAREICLEEVFELPSPEVVEVA